MKKMSDSLLEDSQNKTGSEVGMPHEYLTPDEVAKILRVRDLAIYRWLENGKLRGIKISPKVWLIKRTVLDEFLNSYESEWCYDYGMKLIGIGGSENIKKGIKELERAIEIYPKNKEAYLALSHIYLTQADDDKRELPKAIERLKELLELHPEEIEVHPLLEKINKMMQIDAEDQESALPSSKTMGLEDDFTKQLNSLASSYKRFSAEMRLTARRLCEIVAQRDGYQDHHFEQRTKHTRAIAQGLGFEGFKIEMMQIATFLYDIGKIYINKQILLKPKKLNQEELELIREHPRYGERLLRGIGLPDDVLSAVAYHHESYDGSGYPYGLSGTDIPIEAQIIKLVDAYGAMVSERPYRKPLTHLKAVEELKMASGKHIQPALLESFLAILEKEQESLSSSK